MSLSDSAGPPSRGQYRSLRRGQSRWVGAGRRRRPTMTSEPPSSTSAEPAASPGTGSNPVPGNAAAAAGSSVDAAAPYADPVVAAAELPVCYGRRGRSYVRPMKRLARYAPPAPSANKVMVAGSGNGAGIPAKAGTAEAAKTKGCDDGLDP